MSLSSFIIRLENRNFSKPATDAIDNATPQANDFGVQRKG